MQRQISSPARRAGARRHLQVTALLIPLATACVDPSTMPGLVNSLGPPGAGPAIPTVDPNQQRLEAWTGRSFAHDVTEGDDKSATLFENLTGKDDWADLFDSTGQTFEQTCTIGFLFSPTQKVETAAIQEDDALFGSNCSTYIKDPVQGM